MYVNYNVRYRTLQKIKLLSYRHDGEKEVKI